MPEIELKLQVPAGSRAAVLREVAGRRCETVRLQARYFDTPDRRLAAAGLALRLRKEGRRWVQTLKSRGDGMMERGEHEVILPASRQAPALDPCRHAGTEAGEALAQLLDDRGAQLVEIFATDIRRTRRRTRRAGGVLIEVALDEGEIRAGSGRLQVCELELELLRGSPAALPAAALRWVQRHGLWLDIRSKAQRGERLASPGSTVAATKAVPPALQGAMSGEQALREMLASGIAQVLANAGELADGSGTPEHLHQCRIGMRRLRCALRDFGALDGELAPAECAAWQERLAALFRRFGGARDRDALGETLLPALAAAGAPVPVLPLAEGADDECGAVLRQPTTNGLWLEILAYVRDKPPAAGGQPAGPLRVQVRSTLRALHRKVARDAGAYAALDEARQHRKRKRLKRLRYGVEFCSALYPAKAVARYLAALRPAQDALGEAHDLVVARELFQSRLQEDARVWFILGWLAARRPTVLAQCSEALAHIGKARRPWARDG
jgi:triphosphatase